MTAEIVHDPAGKTADVILIFFSAVAVIHIRFDLEHISDQFFPDRGNAELKRRVSPEHESHLKRQILCLAAVKEFFIERRILSGRLVHVHGKTALHAAHRGRNQFIVRDLHNNSLKTGIIENFLFRHPVQPFIRLEIVSGEFRRFGGRIVIHHTDDLIDIRQTAQGIDFSQRMFMADADLRDFDFFHF